MHSTEASYLFSAHNNISTPTQTDKSTTVRLGIRVGDWDGITSNSWTNTNDDIPYAYHALGKDNKLNVFLSSQEKDNGASQINSRLQLGYSGYQPDPFNMNTLDVNGNINATEGIRMGDSTGVPSASNVGTQRYRADANNSYVEMCMQSGVATYEWVIMHTLTW
jgi:hypothetical protein